MTQEPPDHRAYLLRLAIAAGDGVVTVVARDLKEVLEAAPPVVVDLTVTQVAAAFGKAESTVRSWLEAGEIPGAYKAHGKQWRIPPSALSAFQARLAEPREGVADLSRWRTLRTENGR